MNFKLSSEEVMELNRKAEKRGALEEITRLKKSLGYNNEYWQYLEDRKKELEGKKQ